MKPGKPKRDLPADDLREALKGKVRHPYITGQGLGRDEPEGDVAAESTEEGPSGGESEPPEKGD